VFFCGKVITNAGPLCAFITERPAWNANSCWTCQEISRFYRNPNVGSYVHKKELMFLILCQLIPFHTFLSCSLGCNTGFWPSRHRFFMVSLGPRANTEMVPAFPSCLYISIKWQTDAAFDSFYSLSNYLLNMFRATSAHHQESSLLYIHPPVICVASCLWHCLVANIKVASTCFSCSPPNLNSVVTNCLLPYYVKRPLPPGDNSTAVNKYYYYYYYYLPRCSKCFLGFRIFD
jgi:hypothetical protein